MQISGVHLDLTEMKIQSWKSRWKNWDFSYLFLDIFKLKIILIKFILQFRLIPERKITLLLIVTFLIE